MTSIEKAKEKLSTNRYDLSAWNVLIKDALDKDISQTREFFEELTSQFPTCGRFWKIYIEQEIKEKNYQNAEILFKKCLDIANIDLWKCYLSFLKETKQEESNYNEIMIEAYDLALKKIGLDVMSYSIWQEYISFLKSIEANLESEEQREALTESIRSIYIEANKTPMINIEQIRKDYITFETQINPEIAKQIDESSQKEFQLIKRISREYESITRPLERHLPAIPLSKTILTNTTTSTTANTNSNNGNSSEENANGGGGGGGGEGDEPLRQSAAWKRYIIWEKKNPLNLESHQDLMKRVMFAYEQSFLCLAYNFDFWYEAADYLHSQKEILLERMNNSLSEEEINELTDNASASLYERAINSYMKNNQLIHLVYADFEELRKNYSKCYEIYEKFLQNNPTADPTLMWIHYIRFVARVEDITAARKMFKRAREDPKSGFQLFIAQADFEYFHTKDKTIGFKILHLGAKKYSHEPEYMLAYIKYMYHLNEDNNTRVLFERILSSDDLPPHKTNEIWSEFLKFECAVGDLASILKVDRKRQKVYESTHNSPNDMPSSVLMIDRYRFIDLMPCSPNELKAMGYQPPKSAIQQPATSNTQANVNSLSTAFSNNVNISSTGENETPGQTKEVRKIKYPMPDFNQMLPFKPTRNAVPGMMHSISGGVFPFPPAVNDLVKRIPPPTCFEGPFVKVDELIKKIKEAEYQEDFQPMFVTITGEHMRDLENIAASMTAALNPHLQYTGPSSFSSSSGAAASSSAATGAANKRSAGNANANNSDEEDNKKTKTMDIYKQRQYKKLIKNEQKTK